MQEKCSKIINYIIAFMIILNCNSIFTAGLQAGKLFWMNLYILIGGFISLLLLNKLHNIDRNYVIIISVLLVYILMYLLLQRSKTDGTSNLIYLIVFLTLFSLSYIEYRHCKVPQIFTAYCNIVFVIALISIFFWTLGSNLHILQPTGTYVSRWNDYGIYRGVPSYYNLYFESQYLENTVVRNTAIFGEAPMASLVFSIALVLEILYGKRSKTKILKVIVLSVAIASTLSSTGYICLIFVSIYLLSNIKVAKELYYVKFIVLIFILIGGLFLVQYFLVQKLATRSGIGRGRDYINCFKVWLSYPLMGAGLGSGDYPFVHNGIAISSFGNSNSFGKILAESGIYICLLYFISIFRSFYIGYISKDKKRIFLTFIILYLFITTKFVNTDMMFLLFSLIAVWNPDQKNPTIYKNNI